MEKYAIKGVDYLDLWKQFEERAESLKESMFQSVTWVLGFAAAVFGFTLTQFFNLDTSALIIRHRGLAILSCAAGIALCIYALFLLREFAHHIRRNWDRANKCKNKLEGIAEIINPQEREERKRKWVQIWHKIGVVVILFVLAFIVLMMACITV